MPPDEVDDINLIQFWKELNHIDVLTMKWNSCIDLRMNSVSHNSLLQGLRLLNRHMLQTTQLVINSLRELALYVHTNVWMENMSRSLWVAHIDLIPCQNQFGPRLCLPNVEASGVSGFHQQCLPVTLATYPLRHHQSTSTPFAIPTSPHMLHTETKSPIFLVVFPLKEWTAYQSPLAGNDETDWQWRVAWKCEFSSQHRDVGCVVIYIWKTPL